MLARLAVTGLPSVAAALLCLLFLCLLAFNRRVRSQSWSCPVFVSAIYNVFRLSCSPLRASGLHSFVVESTPSAPSFPLSLQTRTLFLPSVQVLKEVPLFLLFASLLTSPPYSTSWHLASLAVSTRSLLHPNLNASPSPPRHLRNASLWT